MVYGKRVFVATIFGIIFGFVCMWLASNDTMPMTWYMATGIVLSRALIGFVIGISALKINWALHGILMGLIFSLPMAFNTLFSPSNAVMIFIWTIIMGIIYGFLIELFTTKVFKAPMR